MLDLRDQGFDETPESKVGTSRHIRWDSTLGQSQEPRFWCNSNQEIRIGIGHSERGAEVQVTKKGKEP